MKKNLLCLLFVILGINCVLAGTNSDNPTDSVSSITENQTFVPQKATGFGLGLEYGGVGGNLTLRPVKRLSVFAGIGYALAGLGYNVGAKIHLTGLKPASSVGLNLIGMYGYNAAVSVSGASYLNKLFYGGTFGLNLDYKPTGRADYFSFSFLVPVSNTPYENYKEHLEQYNGVEFKNDILPFRFSLGWMFRMG